MKKSSSMWIDAVKIGGAYIAFCIGSGYATGQEILQFFSAFGWLGIGAALISMVLFIWMGASMMKDGREIGFKSAATQWKYYCGKTVGSIIDTFATFFNFGVYTVMIGGAGAAVNQYLGLPDIVGRLGMTLICFLTVLLGLNKLVNVLGVIGPVIIVFSLSIGTVSIITGFDNISTAQATLESLEVTSSCGNWLLSGFLYAGFMAIIVFPFMFSLAETAETKESGILGGALGGFFLTLAILVMHMALFLYIDEVYNVSIPTLVLANKIHPVLAGAFTVVVMLGIFSTAVPLLWMVCRKAGQYGIKFYYATDLIAAIAAFILSMLPFTTLVNTIYPYTGYLGIIVMILFALRQTIWKNPNRIKEYQEMDRKYFEKLEQRHVAK